MARATRTQGFLGCSGFLRALSTEGLFNRSCDQLHHPWHLQDSELAYFRVIYLYINAGSITTS